MLSGLSKAISIPKAAELTASFVDEGSAISESNLTIGSMSLTPRRISSTASFTLEALVQSNPQIDNWFAYDLTRQIAQAVDDAALEGDGVAPNPTGIVNTSGINTLTTTGSSTMTCMRKHWMRWHCWKKTMCQAVMHRSSCHPK